MKTINTIYDLYELVTLYPLQFMDFLKQEFMELFNLLGDGEELNDFNVPTDLAFSVLQISDELKGLVSSPFDLEFVERFHVEQITIYRVGIRFNDEIAIYYTLKGFHTPEEEEWLDEQIEWEEKEIGSKKRGM
jgi:hypothetical protein